jgi:hypothetical protein
MAKVPYIGRLLRSKSFRILKAFKEVVGVTAFFITMIATPLNPELQIEFNEVDYLLPETPAVIKEKVSKTTDPKLLSIFLLNTSSKAIDNIEVTLHGLTAIRAHAYRTTSLQLQEKAQDQSEVRELTPGTYHLPKLLSIPPGHSVRLHFVVVTRPMMFGKRVRAVASTKHVGITEAMHVDVLVGVLIENAETIFAMLAVVFMSIGIRRFTMDTP